jgi:hypothetical protein
MEIMSHAGQTIRRDQLKVFKSMMDQLALSLLQRDLGKKQVIIRFPNGYGVNIFPMTTGGPKAIFEMLVLRFYGPGANDYKMAQYTSIPELNRGNFEEILNLCNQVALWPANRAVKRPK